jgi:NADPH2:quinone reductase
MKAVTVHSFGPHESARVDDMPDAEAGSGQVLVEVYASDVSFPDLLMIEGAYQKKPALPFSPGMAAAGRVIAGDDFVPGHKVLVLPDNGTFAERVAVPSHQCLSLPDEMPFDVAAALGLAYQTAWFALERAGFQAGDRVLVLGASGGVGIATVQLAKALGADSVIAASRGDGALVKAFGPDVTLDAAMENLREGLPAAVRASTGGQGVDIVIDPVGGAMSAAALRSLAWRGRHVIVGFAAGEIPQINAGYLLVKQISVLGLQWTDYRDRQPDRVRTAQDRINAMWSAGLVSPCLSRRLPLGEFGLALADLKAGRSRGKSILVLKDEG